MTRRVSIYVLIALALVTSHAHAEWGIWSQCKRLVLGARAKVDDRTLRSIENEFALALHRTNRVSRQKLQIQANELDYLKGEPTSLELTSITLPEESVRIFIVPETLNANWRDFSDRESHERPQLIVIFQDREIRTHKGNQKLSEVIIEEGKRIDAKTSNWGGIMHSAPLAEVPGVEVSRKGQSLSAVWLEGNLTLAQLKMATLMMAQYGLESLEQEANN